MKNRIHILGASGSGTSTLGKELANRLAFKHFDTDDYFWLPPKQSFTHKREKEDRQRLLMKDLTSTDKWVLSGSLTDWGDIFIPLFDAVIYLWIPKDIRMQRLAEREKQRYGEAINPGGSKYNQYIEFMDWAERYDDAGKDMRSRALHEEWLSKIDCQVIRIEENISTDERISKILQKLDI